MDGLSVVVVFVVIITIFLTSLIHKYSFWELLKVKSLFSFMDSFNSNECGSDTFKLWNILYLNFSLRKCVMILLFRYRYAYSIWKVLSLVFSIFCAVYKLHAWDDNLVIALCDRDSLWLFACQPDSLSDYLFCTSVSSQEASVVKKLELRLFINI